MKKSILFISFFLILLLAGCSQIPKANHITVTPTAPESVDYIPVIAANIGQPTTGMVYLENPNTKERTPFITVTDIYIEHYHNVNFTLEIYLLSADLTRAIPRLMSYGNMTRQAMVKKSTPVLILIFGLHRMEIRLQ